MTEKLFFLSYSRLVGALFSGRITPDQLSDALFFFNCTRRHVEKPWRDDPNYLSTPDDQVLTHCASNSLCCLPRITKRRASEVHRVIYAAYCQAEKDGRGGCRGDGEDPSLDALNQILTSNGFRAVDLDASDFTHAEVAGWIERNHVPLRVI